MNEFFNMGGYTFYVWSAYGISFIVLVINVVIPMRREKKILRLLAEKLNTRAETQGRRDERK